MCKGPGLCSRVLKRRLGLGLSYDSDHEKSNLDKGNGLDCVAYRVFQFELWRTEMRELLLYLFLRTMEAESLSVE
jgi:hypothetical protein